MFDTERNGTEEFEVLNYLRVLSEQEICPRIHYKSFRSKHFHRPVLHRTPERKRQTDSLRHRAVSVFANIVSYTRVAKMIRQHNKPASIGDDPKAGQRDKLYSHQRTRD